MSVVEKALNKVRPSNKDKRRAGDSVAGGASPLTKWFRVRRPSKRRRMWRRGDNNDMDSPLEEKDVGECGVEGSLDGGGSGDGRPPYRPEHQYSREELLKYSDCPLSRARPIITDPVIDGLMCWVRSGNNWNNYKRSDTPTERGDDTFKRRSNDPRERVRKEQDGIVLSPQRRSFNSGCFVPLSSNQVGSRGSSEKEVGGPGGGGGNGQAGGQGGNVPARRIGSGRILNRDWENNDEGGFGLQRNRDDRFEIRRNYSGVSLDREPPRESSRESMLRDKGMREEPRVRDRMSRYPPERRRFEQEEPEWFSGGPTSQHDTIELRGFDEPSDGGHSKAKAKAAGKNASKTSMRTNIVNIIKVEENREPEPPNATSSPKTNAPEPGIDKHDFNLNLEDYLQLDSLPILTNGSGSEVNSSGSRFTQWFQRDGGDGNDEGGRRASQQDELIKNMINDMNEPVISIPRMKDTDAFFAPISPAGTTSGNPLLEMLQSRGAHSAHSGHSQQHGKPLSIKDLEASGKVTSVEELEARMRQTTGQSGPPSQQQKKPPAKKEDELLAFKKLMMQVVGEMGAGHGTGGGASTARQHHANSTNPTANQSALLNEMLNKPAEPANMMAPHPPLQPPHPGAPPGTAGQHPAQMHVPQDLLYKLLHVQEQQRQQQQQEMNKLLMSAGRLAPMQAMPGALSPLPTDLQMLVSNSHPSPELMGRTEAKAILQGLMQGDFTAQHIVQQLQNPAMQPRQREVLASILKLHSGSPRPSSPMVMSDPALLSQMMVQQQLRVPSPLPLQNGMPHRVPSPRELMLHTQTIMQNALIKKKLEEQWENYKKRQELQRSSSPNVPAGAKSPNNNNNMQQQQQNQQPSNNNNNSQQGQQGQGHQGQQGQGQGQQGQATLANQPNQSKGPSAQAQGQQLSPTPLAFTPTSVLRKMSAEVSGSNKDPTVASMDGKLGPTDQKAFHLKLQQPQQQQQHQQQQQQHQQQQQLLKMQQQQQQNSRLFAAQGAMMGVGRGPAGPPAAGPQWQQMTKQSMPQGRAIVKGCGSFGNPALVELPFGNNAHNARGDPRAAIFQQRSKLTLPNQHMQPPLFNNFQGTGPNRVPPTRGVGAGAGYPGQMPPMSQHNMNVNLQLLMAQHQQQQQQQRNSLKDLRGPHMVPMSEQDMGPPPMNHSNHTNQLSHWFTPELLAQSQGHVPGQGKDMMSVEELERQQHSSQSVAN